MGGSALNRPARRTKNAAESPLTLREMSMIAAGFAPPESRIFVGYSTGVLLVAQEQDLPFPDMLLVAVVRGSREYRVARIRPGVVSRRVRGVWEDVPRDSHDWQMAYGSVAHINAHRNVIEERGTSPEEKRDAARYAMLHKLRAHKPRPYYIVPMRSSVAVEDLSRRGSLPVRGNVEYAHRWDVRGHERVRFRRGAHPIPEKMHRDLTERGYRIHLTEPCGEDLARMRERGIEWHPGEWLAVLSSWVPNYVKGPEGAPLIPAIRVGTRKTKP